MKQRQRFARTTNEALDGATLFVGKGIWKAITGETVEGDHIIVGGVRIRLWSCLADDAMIALKEPDEFLTNGKL